MDVGEAEVSPDAERAASGGGLICGHCGGRFPPGRQDKRFCSDRCRAAASREKRAALERQKDALIQDLAKLAGRAR